MELLCILTMVVYTQTTLVIELHRMKHTYTNTMKYKKNWNLKTDGLYQCQYPGCDTVVQFYIIEGNRVKGIQSLDYFKQMQVNLNYFKKQVMCIEWTKQKQSLVENVLKIKRKNIAMVILTFLKNHSSLQYSKLSVR